MRFHSPTYNHLAPRPFSMQSARKLCRNGQLYLNEHVEQVYSHLSCRHLQEVGNGGINLPVAGFQDGTNHLPLQSWEHLLQLLNILIPHSSTTCHRTLGIQGVSTYVETGSTHTVHVYYTMLYIYKPSLYKLR